MNASIPPPLERFSAEKYRQWLAGMVSDKPPPTETETDEAKRALVAFLSSVPMVYGLERMTMWDKIGKACEAALETCEGDLLQFCNNVIDGCGADDGKVATCDKLRESFVFLASKPPHWQVECLRVMRKLKFVLPSLARDAWKQYQAETWTEYKGDKDGDE